MARSLAARASSYRPDRWPPFEPQFCAWPATAGSGKSWATLLERASPNCRWRTMRPRRSDSCHQDWRRRLSGEPQELLGERLARVRGNQRPDRRGGGRADGPPLRASPPGTCHRLVQRILGRRTGEEPRDTVVEDLAVTGHVGDDRHPTAQHRLDERQGQSLSPRREDEPVVIVPNGRRICHEAAKGDAREPQVRGHLLETAPLGSLAEKGDAQLPRTP